MSNNSSIQFDTPLSNIEQDLLDRRQLVDLIVSSINGIVKNNHPCIVYGIYGKWGEGKTSILNFIEERLKSQGSKDGINIVKFNPWLVANNDALLHEFFKTLCTNSYETVRDSVKKYGSWAIFLSKALIPIWGDRVAEGLELIRTALDDDQPTLAKAKKDVSNAITTSGKHIIVIIDDVDRLDKEELHKIFQLVRQVADFENCIYILAMDADIVAKSIGNYHGSGSVKDGWDFLDKIIQIPIQLPPTPNSNMSLLVKNELSLILGEYCATNDINTIVSIITPFITTIRELKRYCNQIRFVLPGLKNEVDIVDLCILEIIKNVSVEAYNRIYYSRTILLRKVSYEQKHLSDERKKFSPVYESTLTYITDPLEVPYKDLVRDAVQFLFHIRYLDVHKAMIQKSLCNEAYFSRYFAQLVPSDMLSDESLNVIASKLHAIDVDVMTSIFDEWYSRCSIQELERASIYMLNKCISHKDKVYAASKIAIALSLSTITNDYLDSDQLSRFIPEEIILKYVFCDTSYEIARPVSLCCYIACDYELLDITFNQIFHKAEINYCLNLLCVSYVAFGSYSYTFSNVIQILSERFRKMEYKQQFSCSKNVLRTFYRCWKKYDAESFNEYATSIFSSSDYLWLELMDTLIGGEKKIDDLSYFIKLFKQQIPQIEECLCNLDAVPTNTSVNLFLANYRQILKEEKSKA